MAKACCVCSESKESTENRLFSCSSHGCDVTVHQGCYGIVHAPTGLWFCRKCESQERAARVKCELCPTKEGALKRTDSGSWAHVVCALYIPEVTFGNNRRMEPIVTTKVPRERFSKSCYICEERGMETQATYGACMACHKSSCRLAFHVTCAQKEHLLCEEEDQRDSRNIVYCGYCSTHHKKMMRQKLKQGLRKYPTTPTSSTAPPLPPSTAPPLPPSATAPAITTAPQLSTLSDFTKEKDQKPLQIKDRELPQKRPSTDAPILQHKRKYRRRKLSSSNESTTSEAPSNASDIPPPPAANIPLSPFSATPRSPPSSHTTHTGCKVKGEAMESGGAELLPSSSSSSLTQKGDMPENKTHPLSPIADAQAPSLDAAPSGEDVVSSRKQGGSTSSDQSSTNRTALGAPPRSLHELLERQWEQTAQFILDQAGRQNNAGMMLAHLHQLQSENSRMQSRIMELASQREFYIAINTRLRQTLIENDNRLPNGVQPSLGEGIQQSLQNTTPNLSSSTAASESQSQTGPVTDTLADISSTSTQLSSNSLSKSAQESLLQAHFLTASLPPRGLHYPLLPTGQGGSIPSNQTHSMDIRPQQPHVLHLQQNDTTQGGVFPAHIVTSQPPTSSLLRGTSVHKGERLGQLPSGDVTHVTNTVQVPIVTYPPLPTRGMNALPSSISEPQSAANHSFYGRTFNSDKT